MTRHPSPFSGPRLALLTLPAVGLKVVVCGSLGHMLYPKKSNSLLVRDVHFHKFRMWYFSWRGRSFWKNEHNEQQANSGTLNDLNACNEIADWPPRMVVQFEDILVVRLEAWSVTQMERWFSGPSTLAMASGCGCLHLIIHIFLFATDITWNDPCKSRWNIVIGGIYCGYAAVIAASSE